VRVTTARVPGCRPARGITAHGDVGSCRWVCEREMPRRARAGQDQPASGRHRVLRACGGPPRVRPRPPPAAAGERVAHDATHERVLIHDEHAHARRGRFRSSVRHLRASCPGRPCRGHSSENSVGRGFKSHAGRSNEPSTGREIPPRRRGERSTIARRRSPARASGLLYPAGEELPPRAARIAPWMDPAGA